MVRFECGCIGLNSEAAIDGQELIVRACSRDALDTFTRRPMHKKKFEPVSAEEAEEIIDELRSLIADGYKLREVRQLLK